MSTQKQNYDQLVYNSGIYGIDIKNGIWPGSGQSPGVKGNKGEAGTPGDKGQKGQQGNTGPTGPKGGLGPDGIKGTKGDQAAAPVFTYKGEVTSFSDLPTVGNSPGDCWFVTDEAILYAYGPNGAWAPIGAAAPVKGEKGQDGAKGQKGDQGVKGLDGSDGIDGANGQKGQKGTGVDTNDYYTKQNVDQLIDGFSYPQNAFNIAYNTQAGSAIVTGSHDFNSVDPEEDLFDVGIVTVAATATILNSPVASPELLVINTVIDDPLQNRDSNWTLVQQVFAATPSLVSGPESVWRYYKPSSGTASAWFQTNFDATAYYDRDEVDALIAGNNTTYDLTATNAGTDKVSLNLVGSDTTTDTVQIAGTGGLEITLTNNVITLDAGPVTGQLTFLGPILPAQDPAVLAPTAVGGSYFIYTEAGTAWNGDTVTPGDWAIYRASVSPNWITLDYVTTGIGVETVEVAGGLLTLEGTETNPVISLTVADIQAAVLAEYVTNEQLGEALNNLAITDLNDVDILGSATYVPTGGSAGTAFYSTQVADNVKPTAAGRYSVIPESNTIWFDQSSDNNPGALLINFMIQASTAGDLWIIRAQNGDWQHVVTYTGFVQDGGSRKVTFAEPTAAAAVNGYTESWGVRGKVDSLGITDQGILRYNATSGKFVLGDSYTKTESDTTFLALAGGTMTGGLVIDTARTTVATNSFKVRGRTSTGAADSILLKSYIRPSTGTLPDYVEYLGTTTSSPNEIQTQASMQTALDGYLPLTAGADNPLTGILLLSGTNAGLQTKDAGNNITSQLSSDGSLIMGANLTLLSAGSTRQISATGAASSTIELRTTPSFSTTTTYPRAMIGGSTNSLQIYSETGSPTFKVDNGGLAYSTAATVLPPTNVQQLPTKGQVDRMITNAISAVIPVGLIAAWPASGTPTGWFKLNGGTYNPATYQVMDIVLSQLDGYVQGTLPDWRGRSLVAYGGFFAAGLGVTYDSRTKLPAAGFGTDNPGDHHHSFGSLLVPTQQPQDTIQTTSNAKSYDTDGAGSHTHTITGGDPVTNPPCATIQWVIRHD